MEIEEDDVYTFTMKQSNGVSLSLTGSHDSLTDIVKDFEQWLNGCQFLQETIDKVLYHDDCHKIDDVKGLAIRRCCVDKDSD